VIVGIAIGFPEMILTTVSLFGFITGFAISGYSMIINDIYDLEIDKINQPKRPLPQGSVSIKLAISFSLILLFLGLVSAFYISFYNLSIAALFSLLSWLYNIWGKKNGFIGNSIVASSMAIPFIFGGIITGNLSILTWSISLLAFLSGMGREIIKTISDIEGDRSKDIKSISITLGPKNAARIASLFLFLAILTSIIPIYFNLINSIYLPLLFITDTLFLYSIFKISTDFSNIQALKVKTIILYSMLLGLITFLLNSLILF
jgi:geranylgeranylglycerol-phosphate geranylgeranyltransferase